MWFLVVTAFLLTIAAACGKVPGWIATLLLCLIELLRILPRG